VNNGTASWRSPTDDAFPEPSRAPGESSRIRSFVAVLLGGAVLEELQVSQRLLKDRLPDILRWARPEQLHLTLQFLGDIDPDVIPEAGAWLAQACKLHQPFTLSLAALGFFPNPRRPRVLWVGLGDEVNQLLRLQSDVSEAVARFGNHREKRAFHPHLTLARVRPGSRAGPGSWPDASALSGPRPVPWVVREVHLMRSELRPAGAHYTILRSVPLD
jgi:RNA 2',3'-cyclic 3'-phosphodiesterase